MKKIYHKKEGSFIHEKISKTIGDHYVGDGVTTGFNVKYCPTDMASEVENDPSLVGNQNFNIASISGVNVKLISALKGIPNTEANREITTTATLTFTLGGNTDSITQTGYTSLNDTRNQ